jgi:glycosyltransferase involved in cell wall biosynthesis
MSLTETNNGKRILLITEDPAIEVGGDIYSNNSVNHFWSELLESFDKAYFSMPLKKEKTSDCMFPHKLNVRGNTTVSSRKFYHYKLDALRNPVNFMQNALSLTRDILRADIVLYRLPSVFFPVLLPVLMMFRRKKRIVLFIGGDFYGRNMHKSPNPSQVVRNIIVSAYDFIERKGSQYFKTLANGRQLADKYSAEMFDVSLIPSHKLMLPHRQVDGNSINILYAGRLDKNKSVGTLLSAISLLDEHYRNRIRLFIVGGGPEEENLREQANSSGIGHLVSFEGYVPFGTELEKYFEESDIFVLPSLSEGTTKVIFEAMAYRLAIIATSVGGIPSATENGKCAYLVPPGSPESIRDAIVKVISDDDLRADLIENGTRIVSQNTMEKKLAYLEKLLKG